VTPPTPPLSKSQEIAQAVLATRNASAQTAFNVLGGIATGKSSAEGVSMLPGAAGGGKENPIHVTVSERALHYRVSVPYYCIRIEPLFYIK